MKEIFLDKFTVLDFAFLDNQEIRGESYYCSARLRGVLDSKGFVYDFGSVKSLLKKIIDEAFDHKFLFSTEKISKNSILQGENFFYYAPPQAYLEIKGQTINRRFLEKIIAEEVMNFMPSSIEAVEIELIEDPRFKQEVNYSYTHGLPLHEGNCQRLLHGHRNPIEVYIDQKREEELEIYIANLWQDAHFTQRRIISHGLDLLENQMDGQRNFDNKGPITMAYESGQGKFSLTIPSSKIVLMNEEPSVENIAQLAFNLITKKHPKISNLMVKTYEGLNKGSICRSL